MSSLNKERTACGSVKSGTSPRKMEATMAATHTLDTASIIRVGWRDRRRAYLRKKNI